MTAVTHEQVSAPPPEASPEGRGAVFWWNRAMSALAVVVIGILGYRFRWVCDDGQIFVRVVRQILAGNGPVYSPGERAEASTSTLWQWVLALAGFVTGHDDTTTASWVLGLALTCAGFLLAVDATRRLFTPAGRPERLLLPFGVLLPLALRPVWEYATSGLETGLNTFWTAACWWLLVRLRHGASRRVLLGAAGWIGLGPLVRPEAAILTVVFLLALWLVLRPSWRTTVLSVCAAGALPVAYEIFRMGYYGVIFPMPALTKDAGGSLWGRGWEYVTNFTGPYWLWPPLAVAVAGLALVVRGARHRREDVVVALAPVATATILAAYVVKVGGDYMHARMLLPILFLLILPVAVIPVSKPVVPLAAGLAVWAAACGMTLRHEAVEGSVLSDERAYYVNLTGDPNPTSAEDFIRTHARTRQALEAELASGRRSLIYYGPRLEGDIIIVPMRADVPERVGVIGVYLGTNGAMAPTDVRLVDHWGLVNPVGARFEYPITMAGHSKPLPNAWLLADYADPAAPLNPSGNFTDPRDVTPEQVAAARHALSCGDLAEIRASVREPMSPGRFWKNLTGAWKRTQVTVPPDPFEAERRFCGGR